MDGTLDKQYAHERASKEHLKFRYKQRALVSAWAIKTYLSLGNNFKLVDFGAAEGLTLMELAAALGGGRGKFIGVEYDRSLIESAPPLPENITLLQGDVSSLSEIESDSVDVVTALAILEHLENPLLALVEAKRILKSGGVFIATSPSPFWDHLSDRVLPKNTFGGGHHMTDMTKKIFRKLGEDAGFEMINFFYFMWAPIGFLPYLKIPVSPRFAWHIDKILNRVFFLKWSFVNQCAVYRK